jgi:hypothetical protein
MTTAYTLGLSAAALMLQGCANYMNSGELEAPDAEGVERTVVLYWPKTTKFIGADEAGPAKLMIECGNDIQFDQQPVGIVFRGNPADDVIAEGVTPPGQEFECGRFTSHDELTAIGDGTVSFEVHCRAVTGEMAARKRVYIAARNEPYETTVSSVKSSSFLGKTLPAPERPGCSDFD